MADVSVLQAVLLAGVACLLGLAFSAVVVPRFVQRQDRATAAVAPTTSEVLDAIVAGAPTGIAVVDRFQDVVLSNQRAIALSLVRNRALDERAWQAAQHVFDTGEPTEIDLDGTTGQGREGLLVHVRAQLLLSNLPARYVAIFADDDSENVRMESARRDFVANVSHELKTPVGAMALLSEALLESVDDADTVRYFGQRLHGESIRLGKMITELIELSRLQGAEKLPDLEPLSVDDLVTEAVSRSQLAAEAADITVATDRPTGFTVMGDRELLITALTNLVHNAIAYSPEGSRVSISRSLRFGKVAISVTDRGEGIAKENQERVFERFFRVDKARSRATGGTGLGLAIVKHVAANHNGSIDLWSRLGTGSTFTLSVPSAGKPAADGAAADTETKDKVT
jgi:two-component system sensor histidine kinase SenX3